MTTTTTQPLMVAASNRADTMKPKILKVVVQHKHDEDADTSYLGEFTDDPQPNCFIRYGEHQGKLVSELGEDDSLPDRGRNYRFFLPAMTGEETGNPESPKQDWERMEALNDGHWCYIGIIAKAEVQMPSGIIQTLRSGGLWGVESDSEKEHLESVAKEELDTLATELESIGCGKRAIAHALKDVETVRL